MFLHVMRGQNLTESNVKKVLYIYFMISDIKIYLHNKNVCHNVLKICKYTQEMIEMIFF
jgi:hypothetical protein